jgi:hypothetical protein
MGLDHTLGFLLEAAEEQSPPFCCHRQWQTVKKQHGNSPKNNTKQAVTRQKTTAIQHLINTYQHLMMVVAVETCVNIEFRLCQLTIAAFNHTAGSAVDLVELSMVWEGVTKQKCTSIAPPVLKNLTLLGKSETYFEQPDETSIGVPI